jgi:hypothetical protein
VSELSAIFILDGLITSSKEILVRRYGVVDKIGSTLYSAGQIVGMAIKDE